MIITRRGETLLETQDATNELIDKIANDLSWKGTYCGTRGNRRVNYCKDFFTMDIES